MTVPDFESDQDFTPFGMNFEEEADGQVLLNAQRAEEFDPRIGQDIEGLLFLGYLTDDFEQFGHTFTIRTLRRGERLACAAIVKDYEDSLGLADALQTAYVAAALVMLDGRAMNSALSPEEDRDPAVRIRSNFSQVSKWYDPVIEAVYDRYSNLLLRQAQAFAELEGKSPASRLAL